MGIRYFNGNMRPSENKGRSGCYARCGAAVFLNLSVLFCMRASYIFLYVYEVKININVFSEFNLKEANKIKKKKSDYGRLVRQYDVFD